MITEQRRNSPEWSQKKFAGEIIYTQNYCHDYLNEAVLNFESDSAEHGDSVKAVRW